MRRMRWVGMLVLATLAGVAIGVASYNAGVNHGLAESGRAVQIVREVPGFGFFPFGLLLFPLFFFLFFGLLGRVVWGGRWRGGFRPGDVGHRPGGTAGFDEWHRRQHQEGSGEQPGASQPFTA